MRVLLWAILFSCVFILSCSGDPINPTNQQIKSTLTAENQVGELHQLLIVIPYRLSEEDITKLSPDLLNTLAIDDSWRRTPQGFELIGPAVNTPITIDGLSETTDENGYFFIPLKDAKSRSFETQLLVPVSDKISLTGKQTYEPRYRIKNSAGVSQIWKLEISSCCSKSSSPEGLHTKIEAGPMDGRCMDHNGPWTDGGNNWPKDSWQAFENFVFSDCQYGLVPMGCWTEHFTGQSCWEKHGENGCSIIRLKTAEFELYRGTKIRSKNERFYLEFQWDRNLVLYDSHRYPHRPLWNSNTQNIGANKCIMQHDGNLVIYRDNQPLWNSGTWGNSGAFFIVQDDGNLVIYKVVNSQEIPLWNTGTVTH